jgi:predicted cobalt transporter CbtA
MPAGDLGLRQLWWAATAVATALALYLIARRPKAWALPLAVVLIALPHAIGAPAAADHASAVPAGLAANFATNALAAGAAFWAVIGALLGLALDRSSAETASA